MKLINVGFNNMILDERIVAIVSPDSAPAKRIVSEAKESSRIIDCTGGRRTKSVIITDSDHVILSALAPESVSSRLNGAKNEDNNGEDK
ncbi:MAG: DUF370 domain-containing protein [Clostridia bacterium]|nr:DUF370 domain-containing protein [Clostridia bacterium]MBQ7789503.1 DUF370 domain-containing protein [Clostridia bacterium]